MANTGVYDEDFDDIDSILEVASDTDSLFVESPVDGYFIDRSHPADVFVENSSISAEAQAKAREVAEQRASSSSQVPPSHTNSLATAHRSIAWNAGDAPANVNVEPPPPDYEAATQASSDAHRSPISPQQSNYGSLPYQHSNGTDYASRMYGTDQAIGQSGLATPYNLSNPSARNGLQSMSDYGQQYHQYQQIANDEGTALLSYNPARKTRPWAGIRRCCRPISTCNGILIVAVIVLIILLTGGSRAESSDGGIQKPLLPGHGPEGGNPTMPTNPALPSSPPSTSVCRYANYSDTLTFDFHNLQNFYFGEFIDLSDHRSSRVHGNIAIRPAAVNQDADVKLHLSYATTRPWKVLESDYEKMDDGFVLKSPILQNEDAGYSGNLCMYVFVAIELRPGVTLHNWETSTSNLDIDIAEGVFQEAETQESRSSLHVTALSTFTAVRGNVKAAYWSSRETEIEVIAGSITGKFALRDLLSLQAKAGRIDVDVDPKKVDKDRPRPAESIFNTVAGMVTARYPKDGDIPKREYRTRVETVSSSISGSWILGAFTSMRSQSGYITADFLPFFDRHKPAKFYTDTRSGYTKLSIMPTYDDPKEPWAKTDFTHKTTSTSGSITVIYPSQWEGAIKAQTFSGSVGVKGNDVKIIEDRVIGPIHMVAAIKGQGTNEVEAQTTSGSIMVRVQDV